MPTVVHNNRTFDARPDRVDLRDRPYQPVLRSLPAVHPDPAFIQQHFTAYAKTLVLDQGREGACTGFGLAAMVNYLLWQKNQWRTAGLVTASPRMLYHLARLYDEWPGENYEGSSCRGAMKGWHRHGVCSKQLWPYRTSKGKIGFIKPKPGWQQDAAQRPLGAYYRIEKDSINDMQAALIEVGAIYCSATVHTGWFVQPAAQPPLITPTNEKTGGHAFAIVGYTQDGFIVQNSWGRRWGYEGFAILAYEDWVLNGSDAWVAVLGAPMRSAVSSRTFQQDNLLDAEFGKASWFWQKDTIGKGYVYSNPKVEPLTQERAYLHTLVMGNNGVVLNKLLDMENARDASQEVCYRRPKKHLSGKTSPKLAIYAHGGLNDEDASIRRIRVMAPYFNENGIYPLFVTWKTGVWESITGVLSDNIRRIFRADPGLAEAGIIENIADRLRDARDRTVEVACEHLLVKSIWSEMKQNAATAAGRDGGLRQLADYLVRLQKEVPGLEIHLVGHSAGSILLGHLLSRLAGKVTVETFSLFAPACSVAFANQHFIGAVKKKCITPAGIHVDLLDDRMERRDSVGPYGKSLLYLVSRALEAAHKMPLLGMERAWKADPPQGFWSDAKSIRKDLNRWHEFADGTVGLRYHGIERSQVSTGAGVIDLAHGSFDNDVDVITALIRRIRGKALRARVENLEGF